MNNCVNLTLLYSKNHAGYNALIIKQIQINIF